MEKPGCLAVCRFKDKLRNLPSVFAKPINTKNPTSLCPVKRPSHFSVYKRTLLMPEVLGDFSLCKWKGNEMA